MVENEFQAQEREVNLVNEIKETVFAYWPLFILGLAIAFVGAFLYLRYTVPTYQATAKVLVKDDSKTGFGGSKGVVSQLDLFGTKSNVDNEIEIIKSRPILQEAVVYANTQIKIFGDGTILDRIQEDFPISFIPLTPDSLKGSSKQLSVSNNSMNINGSEYPLNDSLILDIGLNSKLLVRIVPSRLSEIEGKKYTLVTSTIDSEVGALSGALAVAEQSKEATVIGVNLSYQNPIWAERILDAIIKSYTESNVREKRLTAEYTLQFIEDRLGLVTQELDSVEKRIEDYKTTNQIFNLSAQSEYFLKSVQDQDVELNKINIQLSALAEVEAYIRGNRLNGTFPSLLGISEPMLASLLTKLYETESLFNRRKALVGDKDPELLNLQSEVEKLKSGIIVSVSNVRLNLLSAKRPIEEQLNARLSELSTLPSKERALLDISRQQTIKNSIYTFLLQKREESAISYASTLSDIRILEPAKGMDSPISPKRSIIWLVAFVLGLAIPAGLVILKERLNSKILFRSDIEKLVSIPIIGEIFQSKLTETDLIFVENSRSVMAESIRSVRTKLPFYFMREDEKVLLVSSSVPGEGKSFMASNLGLSISMMGKKTLIIGGDMRKPKLHKTFGISNAIGLSTYLIGKCTLEEMIVETEHENLFVLPSGPIPPNPSELLVQDRWPKLMEELKIQFDFIVLDTPPLGLISDAEMMAKQCDLSLFVVRHDHSPKEAVKKVLGTKDFANRFPRTVLVFNGLKQRGIGYYGYGYGDGYGYGYGGYSYGGYAYGSEAKRTPLPKRLKKRLKKVFK